MSSGNASWIGRKGRSNNVSTARSSGEKMVTKHKPYASSHMFAEFNRIVELFTERQKELVEETGFKAFSRPIHEFQFDRQFTTWLMPKVDTINRSISVCVGKRLMMFQEDAAMVFGIPFSGKEVWDAGLDKSGSMRKKIENIIRMDGKNLAPSTAAFKTP